MSPRLLLAAFVLVAGALEAEQTSPGAEVILLVNDATPPEQGTGSKGASLYVAEHYARARGVPAENIVHLKIPLAPGNDPRAWDSWNITWAVFENAIRQPLRRFLRTSGRAEKVHYIVSTYGMPLRINKVPTSEKERHLSVDSFLASLNSGTDELWLTNPYKARVDEPRPRFRDWKNPNAWKMYLVTRLDGPSAQIAAGLVDKAVRAETKLQKTDGIGYFDYQHRGCCPGQGYYEGDQTMLNAYRLSVGKGFKSVLNDQTKAGDMLRKAPNTLWAWGWYSGPRAWEGYEFVEGAVGAQLTSYTANSVRTNVQGAWVPIWLLAGVTATWGATGEPTVEGYAPGDNLLNHFWNGYNFAESAYLAAPVLNHMMVFLGDPLYAPRVFQHKTP